MQTTEEYVDERAKDAVGEHGAMGRCGATGECGAMGECGAKAVKKVEEEEAEEEEVHSLPMRARAGNRGIMCSHVG